MIAYFVILSSPVVMAEMASELYYVVFNVVIIVIYFTVEIYMCIKNWRTWCQSDQRFYYNLTHFSRNFFFKLVMCLIARYRSCAFLYGIRFRYILIVFRDQTWNGTPTYAGEEESYIESGVGINRIDAEIEIRSRTPKTAYNILRAPF